MVKKFVKIFAFGAIASLSLIPIFPVSASGIPTISYIQGYPAVNTITIQTSINPNGSPTSVWVEYGTSRSLFNYQETGHQILTQTNYASAVSLNVTGLTPSTTYYLRVAANSSGSTVKSETIAVDTTAAPISNVNPAPTIEESAPTPAETPAVTEHSSAASAPAAASSTSTAIKPAPKKATDANLSATAILNNYFLPKTIPNWIAFVITLLVLTVLFRKVHHDHINRPAATASDKKGETADHIPHLPV